MDFHARQYDPQIGRFLGVDPLATAQGQDMFSPFAAMGNQPETMIDPNGEAYTHSGIGISQLSTFMSSGNPYSNGESAGMMAMSYLNGSSGKLDFNWGDGGNGMSAEAYWERALRLYDLLEQGSSINPQISGEGEVSVNYLGASPSDGDQVLTSHNENGQLIYDMPSTGAITFMGFTYNLRAFEAFYNTYHNKFIAKSVDGFNTAELTDFKIDGKKSAPYAEVGTYLTIKNGIITTGENIDAGKKGTSYNFRSVDKASLFTPANKIFTTLHLHTGEATITFKYKGLDIGRSTRNGPSEMDYHESWRKDNMRSVIVDRSYIYLYGRQVDPVIMIKR